MPGYGFRKTHSSMTAGCGCSRVREKRAETRFSRMSDRSPLQLDGFQAMAWVATVCLVAELPDFQITFAPVCVSRQSTSAFPSPL
jgi:hypothetical protein